MLELEHAENVFRKLEEVSYDLKETGHIK